MSKFNLGMIVQTQGVAAAIPQSIVMQLLIRHSSGDWGDLCAEDKKENEFALDKQLRIFSSYQTQFGKVYVITEADRSSTTVLLPEEY